MHRLLPLLLAGVSGNAPGPREAIQFYAQRWSIHSHRPQDSDPRKSRLSPSEGDGAVASPRKVEPRGVTRPDVQSQRRLSARDKHVHEASGRGTQASRPRGCVAVYGLHREIDSHIAVTCRQMEVCQVDKLLRGRVGVQIRRKRRIIERLIGQTLEPLR